MKLRSIAALLALSALSLSSIACSGSPADASATSVDDVTSSKPLTALSEDDPYAYLGSISEIVSTTSEHGAVRVISTFGGDPAINGVYPVLVVDRNDGTDRIVYELDMSLAGVVGVAFTGEASIDITVRQDTFDEAGEVVTHEGHIVVDDVFATETSPTKRLDIDGAQGTPEPLLDAPDAFETPAVAVLSMRNDTSDVRPLPPMPAAPPSLRRIPGG